MRDPGSTRSAPSGLSAFMNAIGTIESSNNYGAVGPDTGKYGRARGRYQIMEAFYPAWAREAGVDPKDMSPAAQDRVASYKMTQYWNRYGSWDLVAVAWFAGPARADKAKRSGISSVGGISDVLGTSVSNYVSKAMGVMSGQRDRGTAKAGRDMPRNARMDDAAAPMSERPPRIADWVPEGFRKANEQAAPTEAAPEDDLDDGSFQSIMNMVSTAAAQNGGQVLDLQALLGMPKRRRGTTGLIDDPELAEQEEAAAEQPAVESTSPIEGLEGAFGNAVASLLAEAGGRVHIVSGRRSRAEQERLYQKYLAGTGNLAAKPGTSNHETGEAVDFGGDLSLVARLAPKYGLHAPVRGEPWHWELA